MPTFATPGPIAATVVVGGAQVRVTASDRTDTVVGTPDNAVTVHARTRYGDIIIQRAAH
jgi:hypothetical protein